MLLSRDDDSDLLRTHPTVSVFFGPTEEEADFCGEENDQMSTIHERTVHLAADKHFNESLQRCSATGLACFHLGD